jgi:hypothetical protein
VTPNTYINKIKNKRENGEMNEIKLFEGEEIRIITDEGNVLINLVETAKICGLTKKAQSGNIVIRWKDTRGVVGKLKRIRDTNVSMNEKYKNEINYLLDEIENVDDRNSIYMSSWMSKRFCMECHSEKAMRYKNFLATLDDDREKNLLSQQTIQQDTIQAVTSAVNAIIPAIIQQFTPLIQEANEKVEQSKQLIEAQNEYNIEDRNKIKEMIGLRSVNVKYLTERLKMVLSDYYQEKIVALDERYRIAKLRILNKFDCNKWEDIPIEKQHDLYNEIDNVIHTFGKLLPVKVEKKTNIVDININKKKKSNNFKSHIEVVYKNGVTYQRCSGCGEYKIQNEENFYKKPTTSGFDGKCKECKKEYYKNNRIERLSYQNGRQHKLGVIPRSKYSYNKPKAVSE